ncbi:MAG: HipA domain-containing protein [Sutterellaceae bacterium]|nr:HipA domain-containing protein [Sutterellaceae bacterium]
MKNLKSLTVWSHDDVSVAPVCLGKLDTNTFAFDYCETWSKSSEARRFNPIGALPETPLAASLITDSLPDSWGRGLIKRLGLATARKNEVLFVETTDADVLAGVTDSVRMGAYRFSQTGDDTNAPQTFVGVSTRALPRQGDLKTFLELAATYEAGDSMSVQTLSPLVEFGASLGGSRPKVNFVGEDGALWIAKLPSIHDERNYGAWEYVAFSLARDCGIKVPEFGLVNKSIFVTKRFDRTSDGKRRHYFSTRALLGAQKNREARSYLEILGLIERICGNRSDDIEELFRRVVFKIMISDGDDHLRNHGFLLTENGWSLAPAFDMTPSTTSEHLVLTWDEKCPCFNLKGLISAAPIWGIGVERAREIVDECREAVSRWEEKAREAGLSDDEIKAMAPAFRHNQPV